MVRGIDFASCSISPTNASRMSEVKREPTLNSDVEKWGVPEEQTEEVYVIDEAEEKR